MERIVLEEEDNMKKILFCMIVLCLCACDSAEKKKPAKETPIEQTTAKEETKEVPKNNDKYVYIDAVRTLHIDKRCVEYLPLMYENISTEKTICLHGIKYILKNKLTHSDFYDYCSQCTEVEDYKEIQEILRINENRQLLYNILSKDYDLGTYEQFATDIQDREKRKKLYDAIKNEGYTDIGENFEEFTNLFIHNQ